jgi:TRAP-type C4-dicarboxylate transport system substrate-binding protein
VLVGIVLVVALVVTGCPGTAPAPTTPGSSPTSPAAPKYHWRFQVMVPESDLDYQITSQGIAALIEKVSEGQIKVDVYPAGALVGEGEIFSAVIDGSIEMGIDMTGAVGEMIPTDYCTGLHGSAETLEEYYDLIYRTGLMDIFRKDFQEVGVHLLCITLGGPDLLRASFRLDGWDAIKGKKGWANPAYIPVLEQLGAVCVDVPGYDMYSAMKLGTIEWHGWSVAELETMGWKEVTKSLVLDPPMKIASDEVYVNQKAWDALSPDLQEKIDWAVQHGAVDWGLEYRDWNYKAIAASEAYGVEMIKFSAADKAKFEDLCVKDWDRIAAMSPENAQCIELTKEWMKKIGRLS